MIEIRTGRFPGLGIARLRRVAAVLAACGLAALPGCGRAPVQQELSPVEQFAQAVSYEHLGMLAVHAEGRLKSFGSHAQSMMRYVSGPRLIDEQSPKFTYLDLMLRPRAYEDAELIFVKNKAVRGKIAQALQDSVQMQFAGLIGEAHPGLTETAHAEVLEQLDARMQRFMRRGLISPLKLQDPGVAHVLAVLRQDLIRTARPVQEIETALGVRQERVLRTNLRFVPPPGGGFEDRWLTIEELALLENSRVDPELRRHIAAHWQDLQSGWRRLDAPAVNEASAHLAALLPQINPEMYPEQARLAWESWYFNTGNMTWVWFIYFLAFIPLLLALVFRWTPAQWIGMGLFIAAFAAHTFAIGLRWYVSGRWPNSNMFEAVTTAAWFGGVVAIVLEVFVRRMPLRSVFALCAAAASATAFMCAWAFPADLDPSIRNMMPVLHDIWLYIHTNVIILAYALIFMAAVTATIYLLFRAVRFFNGGDGANEYARMGGAASLIMTTPDGQSYITRARSSLGQVLDGTTMILMELAFVLLWAGLVMGAIWADHSWGRPWGWDPKEVFALNTFIVFIVLVHTRMKVRDKGFWTAIIALCGAAVMLFNWIAINFVVVGLHSYA